MEKSNRYHSNQSETKDILQPGRLLRVNQIVGVILPISRSHFLAKVKEGKYPQPIKLSERVTCWRSEDIIALLNGQGE